MEGPTAFLNVESYEASDVSSSVTDAQDLPIQLDKSAYPGALVVIDFDDTLVCTGRCLDSQGKLQPMNARDRYFSESGIKTLLSTLKRGHPGTETILLTASCGTIDWVHQTSSILVPGELRSICSIPRFYCRDLQELSKVHSFELLIGQYARKEFLQSADSSHLKPGSFLPPIASPMGRHWSGWKFDSQSLLDFNRLPEPTEKIPDKIVISLSDRPSDMEAFRAACRKNPSLICRAVVFQRNPSPEDLWEQQECLARQINKVLYGLPSRVRFAVFRFRRSGKRLLLSVDSAEFDIETVQDRAEAAEAEAGQHRPRRPTSDERLAMSSPTLSMEYSHQIAGPIVPPSRALKPAWFEPPSKPTSYSISGAEQQYNFPSRLQALAAERLAEIKTVSPSLSDDNTGSSDLFSPYRVSDALGRRVRSTPSLRLSASRPASASGVDALNAPRRDAVEEFIGGRLAARRREELVLNQGKETQPTGMRRSGVRLQPVFEENLVKGKLAGLSDVPCRLPRLDGTL